MSKIKEELADNFIAAHHAYLVAHARFQEPDQDDEAINKTMLAHEDALFRFMATPAPMAWMVMEKAKVLFGLVDSTWTDHRDLRLVGNIIAELRLIGKGD